MWILCTGVCWDGNCDEVEVETYGREEKNKQTGSKQRRLGINRKGETCTTHNVK